MIGALAGLLIWAAHFLLIYGFAALACARGFADVRLLGAGVVPLIVGAATAVAILAVAAMLLLALLGPGKENAAARGGPRFLRWLTALVPGLDRKGGVEGKSVSVRVDLGGRRIIK